MRLQVSLALLMTTLVMTACAESVPNQPSTDDIFLTEEAGLIAKFACESDIEGLKTAIDQHPSAVNAKGAHDVSPLIWALTCHGLTFPDLSAERFVQNPRPALLLLPSKPKLEALALLLQAGADPNAFVAGDYGPVYPGEATYWIDGHSAVMIASEFHSPDILKLLLDYGGDPNAQDRSQEHTALSLSLSRGRWLDLGQDMAPFDDRQWENYFILLGAGADASQTLESGYNVLEMASLNRPEIVLQTLKAFPYTGSYDVIVDHAIDRIERGFPNADQSRALLEFLSQEKHVDVESAFEAYRAYVRPPNDAFE